MPNGTTEATYRVVVNHEEQYSIHAAEGESLRTAEPADRVRVPGAIVADVQTETRDAAGADLGELISRERRRHAETRAASELLTDAAGARVCCVMCFNKHHAAPPIEDAG